MHPILIEIPLDRPGFGRFIGSWLCPFDRTMVVDVGPSRSLPRLIEALSARGIRRVDYVLLTHIHLDHAGGLAEFLDHFPMARAVCHSKAIPHLVDPAKLWLGSRKTLGDLAEVYGPVRPVDGGRLIPHTDARAEGITVMETPGHAAHHLSFILRDNLFAGEAGGIYVTGPGWQYLRPATPPVFFLKEFVGSIDRLLALEDLHLCYAHFGEAESSHRMLKRERAQLLLWEEVILHEWTGSDPVSVERCMTALLSRDTELTAFHVMSPEEQERERFFMGNSIRGYAEYIQRGDA